MNRVKVWAYTVVVAAVAAAALRANLLSSRSDAVAALDARLAAAAAEVAATTRSISRDAAAAAAFTARDEKLVEALHAKEPVPSKLLPRKRAKGAPAPTAADEEAREAALRDAARAALDAAEKTFGFDLPDGTVITAGNREWLARKGEASVAEGEAMGFLRGAIAGKGQRGWVRLNGAAFYAAAAPAGDGAGVVVLVPLDQRWLDAAAAATGAEVTLSAPSVKPLSTLKGDPAQAFAAWTGAAGAATDVGRLGPASLAVGPVKIPRLPQPWGAPAAWRARAVPLDGLKSGYVVLAIATASSLGGLASSHYLSLAIVAGLLLVGVAVGFLVRPGEAPAIVPDALVAAASRIERGDFAARAPALAGRLGTISAALNKAAELAGPAAAGASAPAAPEPSVARALPLEPRPEPAPAPAPAPAAPEPSAAVAPAAGLLQAAARATSPGTVEVDEEAHWQQIFQDFLRTRASCGEATEGLTYDKFRLKLEGNKSTLVAKYACRSVKFQVYVKDGKAALKATPVK